MFELILTVALVMLFSAFCSLSEAVLYSVPMSHVEKLAQSGSTSGKALQHLRRNMDQPIAALLSLNTISNTAGAALAGVLADRALGSHWIGLFTSVFTLAILLGAEIIPKTAGVVYSRALAETLAQPIQWLVRLLMPLVWLSSWVTRSFSSGKQALISDDEIAVMTRLGLHQGVIDEDEAKVIHNILELENRTVRDALTPRTELFALPATVTVGEVRRDRRVPAHSRIPVYFKGIDDIVGLVHRRDVMEAMAEDRFDITLGSLMKPVHFVRSKLALNRALNMFLGRGEHLFIALDDFGGTAGVITLEDVLEEILGKEIVDEFDEEAADLRALAEKRRHQAMEESQG
jgi:CBS domain containing-hemolysin-like protein